MMSQAASVMNKLTERDSRVEWRKGICGICPAGCWVEVGFANGKLADIRADSSHTLGMICRRAKHAPEIVYSEHRLRHPLKRAGYKGSYDFKRISWEEAYELIARSLLKIKQESGPEAVSIYTGRRAPELSLLQQSERVSFPPSYFLYRLRCIKRSRKDKKDAGEVGAIGWPVILVNDQVMVGFNQSKLEELLSI